MQGFAYRPQRLEIAPGTTVTWVNHDSVPHDADANAGTWDGPLLAEGESWSRVFPTAGSFLYHCSVHPFMQGIVVVQ